MRVIIEALRCIADACVDAAGRWFASTPPPDEPRWPPPLSQKERDRVWIAKANAANEARKRAGL